MVRCLVGVRLSAQVQEPTTTWLDQCHSCRVLFRIVTGRRRGYVGESVNHPRHLIPLSGLLELLVSLCSKFYAILRPPSQEEEEITYKLTRTCQKVFLFTTSISWLLLVKKMEDDKLLIMRFVADQLLSLFPPFLLLLLLVIKPVGIVNLSSKMQTWSESESSKISMNNTRKEEGNSSRTHTKFSSVLPRAARGYKQLYQKLCLCTFLS